MLKCELENYYKEYNADIEYIMGILLFGESQYKDILQCFPILYNVWYIILGDYLSYIKCDGYIEQFYKSVIKLLNNPRYIWMTNFDLFG